LAPSTKSVVTIDWSDELKWVSILVGIKGKIPDRTKEGQEDEKAQWIGATSVLNENLAICAHISLRCVLVHIITIFVFKSIVGLRSTIIIGLKIIIVVTVILE